MDIFDEVLATRRYGASEPASLAPLYTQATLFRYGTLRKQGKIDELDRRREQVDRVAQGLGEISLLQRRCARTRQGLSDASRKGDRRRAAENPAKGGDPPGRRREDRQPIQVGNSALAPRFVEAAGHRERRRRGISRPGRRRAQGEQSRRRQEDTTSNRCKRRSTPRTKSRPTKRSWRSTAWLVGKSRMLFEKKKYDDALRGRRNCWTRATPPIPARSARRNWPCGRRIFWARRRKTRKTPTPSWKRSPIS